jgi:predicted ATPase
VAVKQGVLNPLDVNILFFERKEREFVYSKGEKRKEIYSTVKDIKIDENGSLSEYPEDFMDEWTSQLSKLI